MAMWGDQTCQRFEAAAVGFETGFSRLRVRPSNRHATVPHEGTIHQLALKCLCCSYKGQCYKLAESIDCSYTVYFNMLKMSQKQVVQRPIKQPFS